MEEEKSALNVIRIKKLSLPPPRIVYPNKAKPLNLRLPKPPEEIAAFDRAAIEVLKRETLRGSTLWTDD